MVAMPLTVSGGTVHGDGAGTVRGDGAGTTGAGMQAGVGTPAGAGEAGTTGIPSGAHPFME